MQHHAAGRLGEAERRYREILQTDPNEPRAYQLLGAIAYQRGRNDVAVGLYKQALAIKSDYADAHYNLGIALRELGNLEDAAASYRQALTIKPEVAEIHSNLGIALQELGRPDEAVACFREAFAIKPDFAEAHSNLGIALQKLGDLDGAVASFQASLEIKPDHAPAHNNLGKAFLELGRLDEAMASYRKAITAQPGYAKAHSNLLLSLNYVPDAGPAARLEEARRYAAAVPAPSHAIPGHANHRDPDRRLRIGLVSGDFRAHSVAHFLRSVLPLINVDGYELYAYATHHKEDDVTRQLKACFANWRHVASHKTDQLANTILADGVDVLVDLSGHSGANRLPVFARKPAPVQVTWLGYSGTTGLPAMDYILCDRWVVPKDEEAFYTETPWRLPDGYLCFSPPDNDVKSDNSPCAGNAYITFGSFNNLAKMGDATIACWAKVLLAVPESRLLLKAKQLGHDAVRQQIWYRFADLGVSRDRVILKGRISASVEHLELYNEVDIALDPFPYCGTTTTAEALWMGAPVVTLRGQGFVERVGDSILRNIGCDDWVADSPDAYVAAALKLAADPAELNAIRQRLRDKMRTSPLCDAPRFARNLEDAFRGMWRTYCGVDG